MLHPDLTSETDYPTREAESCVPFVVGRATCTRYGNASSTVPRRSAEPARRV